MAVDLGSDGEHTTVLMTDPAVGSGASFADAPFGETGNTGLKELIGRNPEEVRDTIEICQLDLPFALQELTQRGRINVRRERQRFLLLLPTKQ